MLADAGANHKPRRDPAMAAEKKKGIDSMSNNLNLNVAVEKAGTQRTKTGNAGADERRLEVQVFWE